MLLISLDYRCRVLHTRSFSSLFYMGSRPFITKVRTVTHCAVYLSIYMLINYAPCDCTRASETSKETTKMVCKDRMQYHDSKCLRGSSFTNSGAGWLNRDFMVGPS